MSEHAIHTHFPGRLIFIGFGSIGQGVLPLILRHVGGLTADRITIVNCSAHRDYEFKTLQQIADAQQTTPTAVYMQVVRDGGATVVGRSMKDEDIRVFYSQPWVMVGSDGGIGRRNDSYVLILVKRTLGGRRIGP